MDYEWDIASGNDCQTVCDIENGPVEIVDIVDLPNLKMVIFHRFLGLFTRG